MSTSITLVRQIAARPAIVFDALTTPDGIAAWWGPDDLPVLLVEFDARVGGAYRVRFQTADGLEHEAVGEILEFARPARLVMSWRYADGGEPEEAGLTSRIEIDVKPFAGGTELTLTHMNLKNTVSAASHERGWSGALAKLVRQMADSEQG